MTDILLLAVLIAFVGGVIFLARKLEKPRDESELVLLKEENAKCRAELSQREQKIGELSQQLEDEKAQKNKFFGENKTMYARITSLESDYRNLSQERDRLNAESEKFKAEEVRKEKEREESLKKLDTAREALEDEKKRIRRDDEERQAREIEERDRMWNEHEKDVLFRLTELCKMPEYAFQFYDNVNLPEGFDGRQKPDFMIDFLGQYIIFDAKHSKSDDLNTYVNNRVKDAVKKYKDNPQVYKTIFFVVPINQIASLKKLHFYEEGYNFYIISPDALAPVLASLKKITTYELAGQMDPQDREAIISLIAEFDYHINLRNAFDLLLAQSGVNVLKNAKNLSGEMQEQVVLRKSKKQIRSFTPTDLKNFMLSSKNQQGAIDELVEPQADISSENIKTAKKLFPEE